MDFSFSKGEKETELEYTIYTNIYVYIICYLNHTFYTYICNVYIIYTNSIHVTHTQSK